LANTNVSKVEVLFVDGETFNELDLEMFQSLEKVYVNKGGVKLCSENLTVLEDRGVTTLLPNEQERYQVAYENNEGDSLEVQTPFMCNLDELYGEGTMVFKNYNKETYLNIKGIKYEELEKVLPMLHNVCHNQGYEQYASDVLVIEVSGVSWFSVEPDWTLFKRAVDMRIMGCDTSLSMKHLPPNLERLIVEETHITDVEHLTNMDSLEEIVLINPTDNRLTLKLLKEILRTNCQIKLTIDNVERE